MRTRRSEGPDVVGVTDSAIDQPFLACRPILNPESRWVLGWRPDPCRAVGQRRTLRRTPLAECRRSVLQSAPVDHHLDNAVRSKSSISSCLLAPSDAKTTRIAARRVRLLPRRASQRARRAQRSSASRRPLGEPGRFAAAVDGDRTPSALAAPRLGVVAHEHRAVEPGKPRRRSGRPPGFRVWAGSRRVRWCPTGRGTA